MRLGENVSRQAGIQIGDEVIPFSPMRYAEALTWGIQTFNLPADPTAAIVIGRTILIVSRENNEDECRLHIVTDKDTEIVSQEELQTGLKTLDHIDPNRKRKKVSRILSMDYPKVWIGDGMEVGYTGQQDGIMCFYFGMREPMEPREIYFKGNILKGRV